MAYTSVITIKSEGIHLDFKIGSHCRALLSPVEEDRLLQWLLTRRDLPSAAPLALELPASRVQS